MTTILNNSSFKVKAESVNDDSGIVPEKGALLFDNSRSTLVMGDGFNWLPLGPGAATKDSVALDLATPGSQVLVVATPVAPITIYDTIVYTIGTTVTPTLGSTVTLTADGIVDVSSDFALSSNSPNTTLTIELLINGSPVASRIVNLPSALSTYQNAWVNNFSISNGDVLTYRFTSDKSATISLVGVKVGVHYR
jgi:hypothetical protein